METPSKNKSDNEDHEPLHPCWFFVSVGIMTIITFTHEIFKPRYPELRVNSATLSLLNLTDASQLTAKWDINLVVSNPNHNLDILYDAVYASVHTNRGVGFLTSTRLVPFSQQNRSNTTLRVQLQVTDGFVNNDDANGIAFGRARGLVKFGVMFSAIIRFNNSLILFNSRYGSIRFFCYPLSFALSYNAYNTGALLTGSTCDWY